MNQILSLGKWNEPYWGGSFGALYSSSEGLGTFINWQRYGLSLEAGLQDFLAFNRKYRLAANIHWSPIGFSEGLALGICF